MTLDDYQKQALKTVLPTANNLPYVALGLAGESGEVANKIKKWIRDSGSDETKLDREAIKAELGDVLWYAAVMASQLGIPLSKVAQANVDKLSARQEQGKLTGNGDDREKILN